jgi:Mrp family chromosome partitioning ATPase
MTPLHAATSAPLAEATRFVVPPGHDADRSAPIVTIDVVGGALRRRRTLWLATAAVGLLISAALNLAMPPPARATATLYLAMPDGADAEQVMETSLSLLNTRAVVRSALQRLAIDSPPDAFLATLDSSAPSAHVLTLSASAPNDREAVRRANAVAAAFLQFLEQQATDRADATVEALQEDLVTLEQGISRLTEEIDAYATEEPSQRPLELDELVSRRGNDLREATQLRSTIRETRLTADVLTSGSYVLDDAQPVVRSTARAFLVDGAAGVIAGLGAGVGWVALSAIVSDTVRRREDVAAALGTPLALTTGPVRVPRALGIHFARSRMRHSRGPLRLLARHIASQIEKLERPAAMLVVSVDSDGAASAAAAAAAVSLGRSGRHVSAVDLSEQGRLARLLGLRRRRRGRAAVDTGPHPARADAEGFVVVTRPSPVDLLAPYGSERLTGPLATNAEVILVLTDLDPAMGALHLRCWAKEAIVVVTAGRSTAVTLRNTAEMLVEAGVAIRSVVLVGSDRTDKTRGAVPGDLPTKVDLESAVPHVTGPDH